MKYLICGLGNIGNEYDGTRHNIGFVIADALAQDAGMKFSVGRHAMITRLRYRGRLIILIKPTTYMNLSGKAVKYWLQKEKIPIKNFLCIVDDIALPTGKLRIRNSGADGGHNGLLSIIESLNNNNFPRLRFGIGNDFAKGFQVEYVLSRWSRSEEKILIPKIETSVEAIRSFVFTGINRTMNFYN